MVYIVNDSEAKVLVVGPDYVPILDAIADEFTHVTKIVVIGGLERIRTTRSGSAHTSRRPRNRQRTTTSRCSCTRRAPPVAPRASMRHQEHDLLLPSREGALGVLPRHGQPRCDALFHIAGGGWAVAGMYEGCTGVIVRDSIWQLVYHIAELRITHASWCRRRSSSC